MTSKNYYWTDVYIFVARGYYKYVVEYDTEDCYICMVNIDDPIMELQQSMTPAELLLKIFPEFQVWYNGDLMMIEDTEPYCYYGHTVDIIIGPKGRYCNKVQHNLTSVKLHS